MSEFTVKELVSLNQQYLNEVKEKILLVDRDVFRFYLNDLKIVAGECNVSINLLKRLIINPEYYRYVEKLMRGEISKFKVAYITNGDISTTINLNKVEIVRGWENLIKRRDIVLDDETRKRYETMAKEVSFSSYLEKIKGTSYDIEIDGRKYSILVEEIISFMLTEQDYFDDVCANNEIKELFGIKKEHFIYACYRYFYVFNLFSSYAFPEVIIDRFNELASFEKIDFEAVNKITTTNDSNLDKIIVNDELREAILEGMPEFNESVEIGRLIQAIYIYIKMCKILTYDDEFYAVNQRGSVAKKHEDITHITSITPQNNDVVCYEFNAIYAKLLDEIGIKFITTQALVETFGGGHAYLTFRWGKFLVDADSVDTILKNDMMNAKMNQSLTGLVCVNKNKLTRSQFDEIVSRVFKLIASREENKDTHLIDINHVETFDEILVQYRQMTTSDAPVSLDEKFEILIRKVNDARMKKMDSLAYTIQLKKILFTKEQQKDNIAIRIVRNNQPDEYNKVATVSMIFILNQYSFTYNPNDTVYYLGSPGGEISIISSEQLLQMFNNDILDFIDGNINDIPGLIPKGAIFK